MSDSSVKTPKAGARVVRVVFTILGLLLFVFGGLITAFSYDFVENSAVTTGTVVSVDVDYSGDSVTYKPTIRFIDASGRKQRSETFLSSSSYNFARNQKVEVRYDLRDPSSMRINTWFAIWGLGFVFLGAGAVLLFISRFIGKKVRQKRAVKPTPEAEISFADDLFDEVKSRSGLVSRESREDHEHETNYTPTVRRRRR